MGTTTDAALPGGSNPPSDHGTTGTGGTSSSPGVGTPPPEQENEASYTAPVASGHWIWSANPMSGKVALIDAATMRVTTADAGLAPTYVAALGASTDTDSSAIVLNVGDDTASVLFASHGDISVETVKVHPGANRMTVSPSGRWALVWSDATLLSNPDPTEGLQDVTVLDLGVTPAVSYPLTVGYRPSRVTVGTGEKHAYFVTDAGISVVDLPATDPPSVARDVSVAVTPGEAATVRDVTVTPDGKAAVIRHEGSPTIGVIALDDGREVDLTLEGPVTDLDLTPDGKLAFAVVRSVSTNSGGGNTAGTSASGTGGSVAGNGNGAGTGGASGRSGGGGTSGNGAAPSAGGVPSTPVDGAGQAGMTEALAGADNGGESTGGAAPEAGASGASGADTAGAPSTGGSNSTGGSGGGGPTQAAPSYVAALSLRDILDGKRSFDEVAIDDNVGSIVLAPAGDTALLYTNATPSDHVVIFDTKTFAPVRTVVVQSPVKALLPSPDGLHAVALLAQASGSQKPGGFALIPLTTTLPPKVVGTDAPPQAVAVGAHQALITVDGTDPVKNVKVHAVYLAQLPAFGTTKVTLASPVLSAGLMPEVNLGFVAQSHPEGRLTFLDLDTAEPRTLTGFELSARVVQGE